MFVEGVRDLQPTDEDSSGYILVTAVHQGHLALEVNNMALQTRPSFHLDCEEMVVVPLEFSPRSKLIVECIYYFMEAPE